MSKKSIDRKQLTAQIRSLRMEGRSDQEIYAQLSTEYYDRKSVAQVITATVTEERKQRFKDAQITLLVLIGLTILFKLLAAAMVILQSQKAVSLIFLVLMPAVNVYFFIQILRYQAAIYRACGVFAILGISRVLQGMAKEADWLIMVDLVLIAAIAGLSFYLDNKLFPHYSPQKMKPDANGDYRVE